MGAAKEDVSGVQALLLVVLLLLLNSPLPRELGCWYAALRRVLRAPVGTMQLGSATQPSPSRCLLLSWLEAL